jgi:hypothetical protein
MNSVDPDFGMRVGLGRSDSCSAHRLPMAANLGGPFGNDNDNDRSGTRCALITVEVLSAQKTFGWIPPTVETPEGGSATPQTTTEFQPLPVEINEDGSDQ